MINSLLLLDLPQSILLADFSLTRWIFQLLLFVVSLWLIFLVLIQRGKGGGLTGALGGSGGSSAFGAKAGDAFTKVTVVSAAIWITLCMLTIASVNPPPRPPQAVDNDGAVMSSSDEEGDSMDAGATSDSDSADAAGDSGATMGAGDSDDAADNEGEGDSDTSNDFAPSAGASSDAAPATGDTLEAEGESAPDAPAAGDE